MALLLNFIIGFLASFMGVIPPGLLNMSAVKISKKAGRKQAFLFSAGVSTTVAIQTYVALLFARYLDKNPEIIETLQQVALGIFICLTIFFFFIAKDTRREVPKDISKRKRTRFFSGMFIAFLNLLPLPYWVYISITFSVWSWFSFEQIPLIGAILGSAIGTFIMLALYIQFFKSLNAKKENQLNMNYIIGIITAIISLITAFKIFREF
jgi:threonine/homoserine/homoserine lactone efflux protein